MGKRKSNSRPYTDQILDATEKVLHYRLDDLQHRGPEFLPLNRKLSKAVNSLHDVKVHLEQYPDLKASFDDFFSYQDYGAPYSFSLHTMYGYYISLKRIFSQVYKNLDPIDRGLDIIIEAFRTEFSCESLDRWPIDHVDDEEILDVEKSLINTYGKVVN